MVCSVEGNSEKTFLSQFLQTMDGIRFKNGRSIDIKYMYQDQRIVIFGLRTSQETHYEVMESLRKWFDLLYEMCAND